jgi:predicted PurR-regulated permease PerM/methylmalonyl-CoA mutase cobalamin-binding subunit
LSQDVQLTEPRPSESRPSSSTPSETASSLNPSGSTAPDDQEKLALSADTDSDESYALAWAAAPILALIIATATLYFARDVLLPLVMALILGVVFSPLVSRLEPYVGRFLSAAVVVLLAIGLIVGIGYFLTVELTGIADEVAGYSDNIGNKLAALQKTSPPWLAHIKYGISDVQRRLQIANPPASAPRVVQEQPVGPSITDNLKLFSPVLAGIVDALLIILLVFFLLYSRRDLRDRFVRLAARARITVASKAIETAGHTISRYLLLFTLTNLAFGVATGTVVWLLGLPSAPLWGLLAFLLRFIPYVGAITSAFLPALVAFAIFPGWSKSLEVLASFLILDQIAAQFAEPILIGRGIDVSPVALLVSAVYWSWLWGLPGLLLATPMTACLKVAGDFIPALSFLSILLGADRVLEDYHDYYRMLLEINPEGARRLATRYCDENGLEPTFNDVIVPALVLMGEERAENHISQENQQLIVDTSRELITELGNRFAKPRTSPSVRVLGVSAPGEVHDLGLLILIELLRQDGAAASIAGENKSQEEICDLVRRFAPHIVCLSCTTAECVPAAVELTRALKMISPRLTIVAGGAAAIAQAAELLAAGCSQVCTSRGAARRAVRRFVLQRARSRIPGGAHELPGFALKDDGASPDDAAPEVAATREPQVSASSTAATRS